MSHQPPEEVDLAPIAAHIWRKKFLIFGVGLIVGALAFVFTLVVPAVWRASATLLLPIDDNVSMVAGIPALGGSGSDKLQVLEGILKSDAVRLAVAEEFEIPRRDVPDYLTIASDPAANQIAVSAQSEDQDQALAITQFAIERLDELTSGSNFTIQRTRAARLEEELAETEGDLEAAEEALVALQGSLTTVPNIDSDFGVGDILAKLQQVRLELSAVETEQRLAREAADDLLDPSPEVPSGVTAREELRKRIRELMLEVQTLEETLGDQDHRLVQARRRLEVAEQQFRDEMSAQIEAVRQGETQETAELEARRLLLEEQREFLLELAAQAPQDTVEFQRALREVEIQGQLVRDLRSQYEQAQIEAAVDRTRYTVLVEPYLEPEPANKNFIVNTLVGIALGGVLGVMLAWRSYGRANAR